MPPLTLSALGPLAFIPVPSFQYLFAHFMNVFRGLRRLKADRPLSQSILYLRIISTFRNPIRRLLRTVYYTPHDLLEQADGGAARGEEREETSAVQSVVLVDGLEDDANTIPQIPTVASRDQVEEDAASVDDTSKGSEEKISVILVDRALLHTEPMAELYSMREIQATTKVRKRALLIGVRNNVNRMDPENVPAVNINNSCREHRDVEDMRSLLEDVYGYDPHDIVSLIDDNEEDHIQPTQENIVLQIRKLVEGAKQNDHFFFHFVGHSDQEDTDDVEEEDRKNEFILTSDGERIMDDELRQELVDPLPPTCSLTAVFDSCHSCSLLDLPHFRCNRVYVPWLNRGKRRTDTILAKNQRKLDIDYHFEHLDLDANLPNNFLLKSAKLTSPAAGRRATEFPPPPDSVAASSSRPKPPIRRPRILIESVSEPMSVPGVSPNSARTIASPVSLYCHGNCRKDPIFMRRNVPKTDVICLSSSKDSQLTWVRDDSTMTQYLVKMLRKQPRRKLKDVLSNVSHDIHRSYIEMHDQSRDYKREVRKFNEKPRKKKTEMLALTVEIHNFQDPQISSLRPLDMDRYFEP